MELARCWQRQIELVRKTSIRKSRRRHRRRREGHRAVWKGVGLRERRQGGKRRWARQRSEVERGEGVGKTGSGTAIGVGSGIGVGVGVGVGVGGS